MKRVINFSGGKTSAYMTILLKPTPDDIVLFTDTKREHALTYKFIDDFERNEGIKVHRAVFTHDKFPGMQGFEILANKKRYLPNRTQRFCTEELKINTAKRYLRSLGIQTFENYIGFRSDEKRRVDAYKPKYKKVHAKFPLYEMGITKEDVELYWANKPYTLEIPRILGNCDLCFLKGKNAIIRILQDHPEYAEKWIRDEDLVRELTGGKNDATYIKGISYREMLAIAQQTKTKADLTEIDPAFNCSCTT